MLKVFSGAVQFALGMLLFRGLVLLLKRVLPLVSTSIGFAWGMGYEPFTWFTTAYAYVVAYTQYALAWVGYIYAWAQYYTLLAHHNLHEILPFSPMYFYGAITLLALIGRSMSSKRSSVESVSHRSRQTAEAQQKPLEFADYFNLGEQKRNSEYDDYVNQWLKPNNPHLMAK